MRFAVLAAFLVLAFSAPACTHAWQSRLLILGAKGDSVVALRLDVTRDSDPERRPLYWRGDLKLCVFAKSMEARTVGGQTILLSDQDYEADLKDPYLSWLKEARKLPGFKEAKAKQGLFADYSDTCSFGWLVSDTAKLQLSIRYRSGKEYPVARVAQPEIIRSFMQNYGEGATPLSKDDTLYMILAPTLSSVRVYDVGGRKLLAAFLGSGDPVVPGDGMTYRPAETVFSIGRLARIEHHFFKEPMRHHGRGFDFFVWLE